MSFNTRNVTALALLFLMLPSGGSAQDQPQSEENFKLCVIGALPKFDDGIASPESIFLATRLECDREERLMLQEFYNDFRKKHGDVSGETRNDYVFGLRDIVMQDTLEGVAAFVLMQRAAQRRKSE